jgi:hypothetical protein
MLLSSIIFEAFDVAVKTPSSKDIDDALEMAAESYPEEMKGKTVDDFDIEYLGELSVEQLGEYADLSSWLESIDDEDEMRSFRGDKWFERMERFYENGLIPPIVIVEGESFVDIGDGRGRVNYANWKGIPLKAWKLKLKQGVSSGGVVGNSDLDEASQERNLKKNIGVADELLAAYQNNGIQRVIRLAKEKGLKITGEGVYKVVFSLGPNRVLKFAKSSPGFDDIAQEVANYECAPDFFPKVYASGTGWAVVERIKNTLRTNKNLESDVTAFFDIDYKTIHEIDPGSRYINRFYHVVDHVKKYKHYKDIDTYKKVFDYLVSKPNFVKFLRAVRSCKLNLADMHMNNYGINRNGHFVIIDSQSGSGDYGDFE